MVIYMDRKFKALFMAVVIICEISVLSHIKIMGVLPNYAFVAILALTIISPGTESIITAAASGLMLDVLSGCMIGMNTLLCMYLSIICVLFVDMLYIKRLKVIVLMCFVLTLLYELIFGILATMLRDARVTLFFMLEKILLTSLLSTVIFIPVYLILSGLKFEKKVKGIKYER